MLDVSKRRLLPSYTKPVVLAEQFNDYFIQKIEKIRSKFDNEPKPMLRNRVDSFKGNVMADFDPVSQE